LSADLPDWTEATLSVGRDLDDGGAVSVGVQHAERFGRTDTYLEARLDRRLPLGGVYVALGGAPDADFRPELALAAGGEAAIGHGVHATLDAALARYSAGEVISLHPGIRLGLLEDRLSLSARWINVRDELDEWRSGYGLGVVWSAAPRLRLRASWADAPETSEGVTVDVRAVGLGFDYDLSDRLTLRLNGVHEERSGYDRDELGVGLGWRY
jgi:YaiO family outer membrane protein